MDLDFLGLGLNDMGGRRPRQPTANMPYMCHYALRAPCASSAYTLCEI
jgi:hypothetical protein